MAPPVTPRAAAALLLMCSIAGCSDVPPAFFDTRVVTTNDADPFDDASYDTFEVLVQQEGFEDTPVTLPISGGSFDEAVQFLSTSAPTRITLTLTGPGGAIVRGATPEFIPGRLDGRLAVLVGEPGACEVVSRYTLPAPRSGLGVAEANGFIVAAGGEGPGDGASGRVGLLDRVIVATATLDDITPTSPLGEARAVTIGRDHVLVLAANDTAFVIDLTADSSRLNVVNVHAGAGLGGLVALPAEDGQEAVAAIVGGEDGGTPVSTVSLVAADGTVTTGAIRTARVRPGVVVLGAHAYVVGGQDAGGEWAERSATSARFVAGSGAAVDGGGDTSAGARRGMLFAGAGALWLIGGDGRGDQTWRITGCPDACVGGAGPAWASERDGVVATTHHLVGGDRLERVDPDAGTITMTASLTHARENPGAIEAWDGTVTVAGGRSPGDALRADVEVCFP